MSDRPLRCGGRTDLSPADIAWLGALPDAANEVKATQHCELSAHEPHSHKSLGHKSLGQVQDNGTDLTSYWVRWHDNDTGYVIEAERSNDVPFFSLSPERRRDLLERYVNRRPTEEEPVSTEGLGVASDHQVATGGKI